MLSQIVFIKALRLTEDIYFAHVSENDCAFEALCQRSLWSAADLDVGVLEN